MKLKNVKRGVRVMLKDMCSNDSLKVGTTGTIMEDLDGSPRVKWDNFNSGTNGQNGMSTQNEIWAVQIKNLKRIK